MTKDKFSAVWISHSSMSDFLRCPRSYYLRNIYRDPKTHHKVTVMSPPLALGQAVHEVIESLSTIPVDDRFKIPLMEKFEKSWLKVTGKKGGFKTKEDEEKAKERGKDMIRRVIDSPGPLTKKAVKIRQDLPYYWFSEEDNIILCGKIDWLEYLEETESVKIIDFKTGKHDEDPDSLQLPIYHLLAKNCQNRKIGGAAYWYIDRDANPIDVVLPELKEANERVMEIAKKIVLARKLDHFVCKNKDGCMACRPLETVVGGGGEFIGESEYHQDLYILT